MKPLYNIKSSAVGASSIKDVDMTKRIVTGIYNAYNFVDDGMEVVLDGAAKKSIAERGPESNAVAKIKHALFHDINRLPGKILVLDERTVDTKQWGKIPGIYFETKMDGSTEGTDTLIKYNEGVYDNHSIGYANMQTAYIQRDGAHGNSKQWDKYMALLINPEKAEEYGYITVLKEIKLWEGSTIGFGMNELTPYLGVKGKEDITIAKYIERFEKLEKAFKIGSLSDDALEAIEIQMLQLKQIGMDLFEKIKSQKAVERQKEICVNCGENVDADENGICPDCGEPVKAAPLTLAQKMARRLRA